MHIYLYIYIPSSIDRAFSEREFLADRRLSGDVLPDGVGDPPGCLSPSESLRLVAKREGLRVGLVRDSFRGSVGGSSSLRGV
jgi:hypothetical protein